MNGISDHDAQLLQIYDINTLFFNQNFYWMRGINHNLLISFAFDLSFETCDEIFRGRAVDEIFNTFLNIVLRIFYSIFPIIRFNNNKKDNRWLTPTIITLNRLKNDYFLLLKRNDRVKLKDQYKCICKSLKFKIKEAKKLYYNRKIIESPNRITTIWNIAKHLTGRNNIPKEIHIIKHDDCEIEDQCKISQLFNEYFQTIAEKINTTRNNKPEIVPLKYLVQAFNKPFPKIMVKNTTSTEIEKIIKSLKPSNTYGYDEISTQILKYSLHMISSPSTYIFNLALSTGIFPARMKYSVVKPLLKKGDKSNMSNYRPISLLTSFSKILEKIIYIRLYKHLITHNILAKEQYGFRENSSTQKAIFNLLKDITNAVNNKRKVGGIFCDLHKLFDCVNHEILLAKLEFCGVAGNFRRLIRSYPEHRYQRVEICIKSNRDKVYSEWERIKHGVP
jgi:hypothetical protein